MSKPLNIAYESFSMFFSPAYMQMRLYGNQGPKHYPSPKGVDADYDGNVTFTFYAPDAQSVSVCGTGGAFGSEPIAMTKDSEGNWSVTVQNITPGFHYHYYIVDGTNVSNPQAPYGYGSHGSMNFFEVPDPNDDTYIYRDVDHGTIHMEIFKSSKTGQVKNCWIYTPPSYATDVNRKYPVLYLHHGGGETEACWIWQGKINYIADNLIAEGGCEEMIIVMNNLYDINYDNPGEFLAGDFDSLLTRDCMPFIESRYRVIPDSDMRAIAGLSMGSYHSAQTACNNPGMFGYVGMLSGSFDDRWYRWCDCRDVIANSEIFKRKTKLFYMSVGTDETRLYPQISENMEYLRKSGVPSIYFECPGYHEWTVWRKSIRNFMGLLFK